MLGSDSNSETPFYTNVVGIWSLRCVIYELLVGAHLFASGEQVSRYCHGNLPFPEDKLKELSPPTGDAGVSLLKSMLSIQPEGRLTAADAFNAWLVDLNSEDEDGGEDQYETAQSGDESSWGRKSEGKLITYGERKKIRGQRNFITQDCSEFAPGDVALGASPGLQLNSHPTPSTSTIDTAIMTLTDVASTENSLIQKGSMKLGLTVDISQLPGDSFQGPRDAEEKTDPRWPTDMAPSSIPNTEFNLSIKHVTNENWLPNPRPPTGSPPTPGSHHKNSVQLALRTNDRVERTLNRKAPAPIPDAPRERIAHTEIYPAGRASLDHSH